MLQMTKANDTLVQISASQMEDLPDMREFVKKKTEIE